MADRASLSPLKQAFLALQEAQERIANLEARRVEPIAIVGMACRIPGAARGPEGYWSLLRNQVNAVAAKNLDRWRACGADLMADSEGETMRWGALLDEYNSFDAQFFGISPREAASMDPQQRLLLEVSCEALEDAAIPAASTFGSNTGVYFGISANDYAQIERMTLGQRNINPHYASGGAHSVAAGRVSYILGWHGPAISIDTACSSSLVAVHLACEGIRSGTCEMALAGGVNLILSPDSSIAFARAGMLSGSGRVRAFGRGADGFVRGEGCGVVVLKRLAEARRSGDRILGVILGSAVNHDGASSGLTVPNGQAQAALLRAALGSAGLEPAAVGYVEAHGTGTPLGDPIEAEALGVVFAGKRERPLGIGSVKTNIGHLEAAAGIAGLIKLVLSLGYGELPAQLSGAPLSEHVRWSELPLEVLTERRRWEPIGGRRIGGVSSFGFSGTNAHVIVEAPPAAAERSNGDWECGVEVLPLSAKSAAALDALAERYAAHMKSHPEQEWRDVCHTAGVGRTHFRHRLAVVAGTSAEGVGLLQGLQRGGPAPGLLRGAARSAGRIGFLFSGQGSQYAGMGRELYAGSAVYRGVVDRCAASLGGALEAVMRGEHPESRRLLQRTEYAQPALFALECGVAAVWRNWGVEPEVVIGHSLGEYAAAAVAGAMTVEEGIALVAARGRLMQGLASGGAMLALDGDEEAAREALRGREAEVSLAAVNGSRQTVLSGARAALEEIAGEWERGGGRARWLAVEQAYHSPLVEPIVEAWEAEASRLAYRRPRLRLLSNLTGQEVEQVSGVYWRRHMREPVRFAACVDRGLELGVEVWVEAGPRAVLLGLARQRAANGGKSWIASLNPEEGDWPTLARGLAEAYVAGVEVDWAGWNRERERIRVALPGYPFERQRHWLETPPVERPEGRREEGAGTILEGRWTGHPLLGERLRLAGEGTRYQQSLRAEGALVWLGEHRLGGRTLLPATAFFEMLLAAGDRLPGSGEIQLEEVALLAPLDLGESGRVAQVVIDSPVPGERTCIRVYSAAAASQSGTPQAGAANGEIPGQGGEPEWRLHAEGYAQRVLADALPSPELPSQTIQPLLDGGLEAIRASCSECVEGDAFYARLRARGADFGPRFQGVQRLWRRPGEALAEVRLETLGERLHPACLDACLQVAAALLPRDSDSYLPFRLHRLRLSLAPQHAAQSTCWIHTTLLPSSPLSPEVELFLYPPPPHSPKPFASIHRLQFAKIPELPALKRKLENCFYRLNWHASPSAEAKTKISGEWVIMGSRGPGEGDFQGQLAKALSAAGQTVVFSPSRGEDSASRGNSIDPGLIGDRTRGIIYAQAPIMHSDESASDITLQARPDVESLLGLCRRLAALECPALPRLYVLTYNTHPVAEKGETVYPLEALLSGLAATISAENLPCARLDLDAGDSGRAVEQVVNEVLSEPTEDWIAFRRGTRYVPRLGRISSETDDGQIQLAWTSGRGLDSLRFERAARRSPGFGELEIEVRAAALNFHDALCVLGVLSSPDPLGVECAGIVASIGPGVAKYRIGDEVVVITSGAFARWAIGLEALTVHKPAALSFEESAAMPVAYLTAEHCLRDHAGLLAGQRVLIHAATGGVGLAAVHLCQRAGAEVYATAGSDRKREYLRSIGVRHVMDSRSTRFAEEIRSSTNGQGVDIVLNSLAGEFTNAGLSITAASGSFIDIGATDVRDPRQIELLYPGIRYRSVNLTAELRANPEKMQTRLNALLEEMAAGSLPLLPLERFSFDQPIAAFRHMAVARHIGKVVLTKAATTRAKNKSSISPSSAYIVTGGMTGLGLEATRWLAGEGAGRIVVVGRRPPSPAIAQVFQRLQKSGTAVTVMEGDVSDPAVARRVVDTAGPELRGLLHCAGALEDAPLARQTWDSFSRVLKAKADGAWLLHRMTRSIPLDFFVMYSSWASLAGSPGAANYCAANMFLDALAHHRQSLGLAATSIDWGPWAEVGMAAGRSEEHFTRMGFKPFSPTAGVNALALALSAGWPAQVAIADVDWAVAGAFLGQSRLPSVYKGVCPDTGDGGGRQASSAAAASGLLGKLKSASAESRRRILGEHIEILVAKTLALPSSEHIDPALPLHEFGLDSILAVELRNSISSALGMQMPATLLFDYPTAASLTNYIAGLMETRNDAGAASPPIAGKPGSGSLLDRVEGLSDEEVDRLIRL